MEVPPLVSQMMQTYYPGETVYFQNTIVCWKQTRWSKKIPYILTSTREHIVMFSFCRKGKAQGNEDKLKDSIKVFVKEAVILENQNAKGVTEDLTLYIRNRHTKDAAIQLTCVMFQDFSNWRIFLKTGIYPLFSLNIVHACRNVNFIQQLVDFESFTVNGQFTDPPNFSILTYLNMFKSPSQRCRDAVDEIFEKKKGAHIERQGPYSEQGYDFLVNLNLQIDMSPLVQNLVRCGTGTGLHQGYLNKQVNNKLRYYNDEDKSEELWQQDYEKLIAEIVLQLQPLLKNKTDPKLVVQELRKTHESFWGDEPEQRENPEEKRESEEIPGVVKKEKAEMRSFEIFRKALSDSLLQRLEVAKFDPASGLNAEIEGEMAVASSETSLILTVNKLAGLLGRFRAACLGRAMEVVDQLPLFSHERTIFDINTPKKLVDYAQNSAERAYKSFMSQASRMSQEQKQKLFSTMTQLGPVHGCFATQDETGAYAGLFGIEILDEEQLKQLPGAFDITPDVAEYANNESSIRFPCGMPNVSEFLVQNIKFKLGVSEGHSQCNTRRGTAEIATKDEIFVGQNDLEFNCIDYIFDRLDFDENGDYKSPKAALPRLSCLVQYAGFQIFCQADVQGAQCYGFAQKEGLEQGEERHEPEDGGESTSNSAFLQQNTLLSPLQQETYLCMLQNSADFYNQEQHLICAPLFDSTPLLNQQVFNQQFNARLLLNGIRNDLELMKHGEVARLVSSNDEQLIISLNQIIYRNIGQIVTNGNGQPLPQQLINTQLSAYFKIIHDGLNQTYYGDNYTKLLAPDLPSVFMEKFGADRQLLLVTEQFKLPLSFIKHVDEKINPDILDYQYLVDESIILRSLRECVAEQNVVKKLELCTRFLVLAISAQQKKQAGQKLQRWCDLYRIQYLPLLAQSIDKELLFGSLQIHEVVLVLEKLGVPKYLWYYLVNFSSVSELKDVIKLEIAAHSATQYINQQVRSTLRDIQQFGMLQQADYQQLQSHLQYVTSLPDYINLLESGTIMVPSQDPEVPNAEQQLDMNYFFEQPLAVRRQMIELKLQAKVLEILNKLLSTKSKQNSVANIWNSINEIIQNQYMKHSFGQEYTILAAEELQIEGVKWQEFIFDQNSIFSQLDGNNKPQGHGKYAKCNSYRQYFLNRVCQIGGIELRDCFYNFDSSMIFKVTDFISFNPQCQMSIPGFVVTQFGFGQTVDVQVVSKIENRILQQFSVKEVAQNMQKCQYSVQDKHVARDLDIKNQHPVMNKARKNYLLINMQNKQQDEQNLIKNLRKLLFARSFYQDMNHDKNNIIQCIFSEIAVSLAHNIHIYDEFTKDGAVLTSDAIQHYVCYNDTLSLICTLALTGGRRISHTGAQIYFNLEKVFNIKQRFLRNLQDNCPIIFNTLTTELHKVKNFLNEGNLSPDKIQNDNKMHLPQMIHLKPAQAFMEGLEVASQLYGGHSIQIIKLRLQQVFSLVDDRFYQKALQELEISTNVVEAHIGLGSPLLMELYNLAGLIHIKSHHYASALKFFEQAMNILWTDLNYSKAVIERLQALDRNTKEKLTFYGDIKRKFTKQLDVKKGAAKQLLINQFINSVIANSDIINNDQQKFQAKSALENQMIFSEGFTSKVLFEMSANPGRSIFMRQLSRLSQAMYDPDTSMETLIKASNYITIRLQNFAERFQQSQLMLSQLKSNMVECYRRLSECPEDARSFSLQSLKTRSSVLGRDAMFTLKQLYQIAELDLTDGNVDGAIASLEFILQQLGDLTENVAEQLNTFNDLNPLKAEVPISRFQVFKFLCCCGFNQMQRQDQFMLEYMKKHLSAATLIDQPKCRSVVKELMTAGDIPRAVIQLFADLRQRGGQAESERIVRLLQVLSNAELVFGKVSESPGEPKLEDLLDLQRQASGGEYFGYF